MPLPPTLPVVLLSIVCALGDPPAGKPSPLDVVEALETAVGDAIAKAEPSVVAISRDKSENDETTAVRGRDPVGARMPDPRMLGNPFDPPPVEGLSFDYGSGVVIGDKGEILTAFHVVRGAMRLRVFAVGLPGFDAEVIAADPHIDLAVIAPKPGQRVAAGLKPLALGDATGLRKGSFLVALGNPFNAARDGKPSAGLGILSNVARQILPSPEEKAKLELGLKNYPTLLQLDAKLNLGMSGGAVINLRGELVGVTTAAANAAGYDAMAGYAIPIDRLGRRVVESLKAGKEYEYGFLGISLDTVQNTSRVVSAKPGSPAEGGGVRVDDVIAAVGDVPVNDSEGLFVAINSVPAGETVRLKILRRGETLNLPVVLAKKRVVGPVIATNRPPAWRGLRVDYTSTMSNTVHQDELFAAMAQKGVVITEVETGSAADKSGLKPGHIVTRVDGASVPTPRDFYKSASGLTGPARLKTDVGDFVVK